MVSVLIVDVDGYLFGVVMVDDVFDYIFLYDWCDEDIGVGVYWGVCYGM